MLNNSHKTAQKLRERAGYFYKYTCVRSIDQSIFSSFGTHAVKYFASLGIFMRQGRKTQDAKLPKSLEVYCICSVTIIRFSLYCPFKREGNLPPPPPLPHLCAEPVRYIEKIKISNKRTTHYAIKILITKFCYGKGIEGKMCL